MMWPLFWCWFIGSIGSTATRYLFRTFGSVFVSFPTDLPAEPKSDKNPVWLPYLHKHVCICEHSSYRRSHITYARIFLVRSMALRNHLVFFVVLLLLSVVVPAPILRPFDAATAAAYSL